MVIILYIISYNHILSAIYNHIIEIRIKKIIKVTTISFHLFHHLFAFFLVKPPQP